MKLVLDSGYVDVAPSWMPNDFLLLTPTYNSPAGTPTLKKIDEGKERGLSV